MEKEAASLIHLRLAKQPARGRDNGGADNRRRCMMMKPPSRWHGGEQRDGLGRAC